MHRNGLITALLLAALYCGMATSASAESAKTVVDDREISPKAHNNAGVQLGMRGLFPEAIAEHQLAVKAAPENKVFRINLSSAYLRYGNQLFKKQDYGKAAEQFRNAIEVDPRNIPAKEGLEKCEQELKKAQ